MWGAALAALLGGCAHAPGAGSDPAARAGAQPAAEPAPDARAALYCGDGDRVAASRAARLATRSRDFVGGGGSPMAACEAATRRLTLATSPSGTAVDDADRAVDHACRVRRCVARRLDHARSERDVINVNCQGDKLSQLDALLRLSVEAREQLDDAVARGDAAARDQQLARLRVYAERITQVGQEANQCIGGGVAVVSALPASVRRS